MSRAVDLTKLSLSELIRRTEAAPDFGWDDEGVELRRRLEPQGKTWRWEGRRLEIISKDEGRQQGEFGKERASRAPSYPPIGVRSFVRCYSRGKPTAGISPSAKPNGGRQRLPCSRR